jgi:large subunit ribosomal protein L14
MLQRESLVNVVDNTWATVAKIVGIPGPVQRQVGIGDVVNVAIQKASPSASVKVWQVCKALIVRTRKETRRLDGSYIRFWDNAVIILDIDTKGEMKPKWKRITWPIPKELREKFKSVTNIAEEVV